MFFRGRSTRNLDPKGRLMLPAEFRESLNARGLSSPDLEPEDHVQIELQTQPRFVLTTYDDCLVAYPWEDWMDMEAKFARLPNPSPKVRTFRRLFIGGAEVHCLDAQGRIRLSQDHRDYAGLDKEVAIIGLINRFELWNPEILKRSMAEQKLDEISDELAASGIDFAL